MSDDADEPAPEQPASEPAPAPSPEPEVKPADAKPDAAADAKVQARRLLVRVGIVGALAAIAIVTVIALSRRPGRAYEPESGSATGDGGASVQAPQRPKLPGDPSNARLTGFVVDGTNTPVVGVEVTAELERGTATAPIGAGSAGSATGSGSGSGSAAPLAVVAPLTGPDGRFVLDAPVPGRYRLRVTGPGLLPAEVRYVPVPSDEARIVVARKVSIEGVVLEGTTPVPGANVGVRGEALGGALEVTTDAKGGFKIDDLPEGRYQVFAWRAATAARAMRVNRLGAGPFSPVELVLEPAAIVTGRVIDRDRRDDSDTGLAAAVELRPSGDDQAPRYARSTPDGRFKIEGVPNGKWIADAYAPGYASPGGVEVDAGHGVPELALARGAMIEGRVIDREGKPIANATVRALGGGPATAAQAGALQQEVSAAVELDRLRRFSGRIAAPTPTVGLTGTTADPQLLPRGELGVMVGPIPPIPPPGAQVARPATIIPGDPASTTSGALGDPAPLPVDPARAPIWTTGSDGKYRIIGVPRGKHVVLASAPGFAEGRSKQVIADPPQIASGIDVTLGAGTYVVGRVTDQHGVKVIGAQVHAAPELGAPQDAFTDDEGMYKLGPLTGTVEISASAYGHADARRTIEIALATGTAPDERREDLVLTVADAVLAGTIDDATGAPVGAAHVEIVDGAGGGRQTVVAPDGTFSIDMLPAGRLRVRITHPAYPTVELDAVATVGDRERVRLRLPLGGGIDGVILDAHSGAPVTAIVNGYGPGGTTADTAADAKGLFKLGPLKPGRWKLTIEQPGYLAASREIDVPASRLPGISSVRDVRFDLGKGALVGGTVRDARGRRVVGAAVTVQAASGDGPTASGSTDSQGEFRIRDAPTGELAVTATSTSGTGTTRVTIRPGDEVLSLSIELR